MLHLNQKGYQAYPLTVNGYDGLMTRQRTETGKQIVIGVRVSETTAEAIDAARGGMSRAAWVESLIEPALGITVNSNSQPEKKRNTGSDSAECPPHPKGRVIKGFCYRCGRPAT